MKIKLPTNAQVSRSFNPQRIISLGDGRLIHQEFVMIHLANGRIAVQGDLVLEDYTEGLVICRAVPYQIVDKQLAINTETIQISLSNINVTPSQVIEIL